MKKESEKSQITPSASHTVLLAHKISKKKCINYIMSNAH